MTVSKKCHSYSHTCVCHSHAHACLRIIQLCCACKCHVLPKITHAHTHTHTHAQHVHMLPTRKFLSFVPSLPACLPVLRLPHPCDIDATSRVYTCTRTGPVLVSAYFALCDGISTSVGQRDGRFCLGWALIGWFILIVGPVTYACYALWRIHGCVCMPFTG
jgi:hypothetical protein